MKDIIVRIEYSSKIDEVLILGISSVFFTTNENHQLQISFNGSLQLFDIIHETRIVLEATNNTQDKYMIITCVGELYYECIYSDTYPISDNKPIDFVINDLVPHIIEFISNTK